MKYASFTFLIVLLAFATCGAWGEFSGPGSRRADVGNKRSSSGLNWSYRRMVIVDNSNLTETLNGYAVKITLTPSNFSFANAESDGRDLRFAKKSSGNELDYWIESYDADQQLAVIWVKDDSVPSHARDTLYVYYGCSAAPPITDGMRTFASFCDFDSDFTVSGDAHWSDFQNIAYDTAIAPAINKADGDQDSTLREIGSVLVFPNATDTTKRYMCWYSSHNGPLGTSETTWVQQAKSSDGWNWIKTGRIDTTCQYDPEYGICKYHGHGERPSVIQFHGRLMLYYENKDDYLGHADLRRNYNWDRVGLYTSDDTGTTWHWEQAVIRPDTMLNLPCMASPSHPSLLMDGDTLWMWVEQQMKRAGETGMCGNGLDWVYSSLDGINWTRHNILPLGPINEYDSGCRVIDEAFREDGVTYLLAHSYPFSSSHTLRYSIATTTNFLDLIRDAGRSNVLCQFPTGDMAYFFVDLNGRLRGMANHNGAIYNVRFTRYDSTAAPSGFTPVSIAGYWRNSQLVPIYRPCGVAKASGGILTLAGEPFLGDSAGRNVNNAIGLSTTNRWTNGYAIETRMSVNSGQGNPCESILFGDDPLNMYASGVPQMTGDSGYGAFLNLAGSSRIFIQRPPPDTQGMSLATLPSLTPDVLHNLNIHQFSYDQGDTLRYRVNDTLLTTTKVRNTQYGNQLKRFVIAAAEYSAATASKTVCRYDWVRVRPYRTPEPTTLVLSEEPLNGPLVITATQVIDVDADNRLVSPGGADLTGNNYGGYPSLQVGIISGGGRESRMILHAPYALIPPGATITSAVCSLYAVSSTGIDLVPGGLSLGIYEGRLNWVEGTASGSPQDGCSDWRETGSGPGVDGLIPQPSIQWQGNDTMGVAADTLVFSGSTPIGTWYTFDVTSIVQAQLLEGHDYGFMIKRLKWFNPSVPETNCSVSFTAKEGGANRGRVRITYVFSPPALAPDTTLALISPHGGEVWQAGEVRQILWHHFFNDSNHVRIDLDRNYPIGGWENIALDAGYAGSYSWLVTGPVTNNARIRVSSVANPAEFDFSDSSFVVAGTAGRCCYPSQGRWDCANMPATDCIALSGDWDGNSTCESSPCLNAPADLVIFADSSDVKLTWSAAAGNGILYRIYRGGTASDDSLMDLIASTADTVFVDSGAVLTQPPTKFYVVKSVSP